MEARLRTSVAVAALALTACAVNPATGRRELSFIGEGREIEMGRDADSDVTASMGLVPDSALQAYVSDLGHRLAAASERPDLPWSYKVVDDPVVNAFALPGGFVYVTRGILVYFESEAELVGVLGHETGHVTARHSVSQMSRQQLQQIGLGVGMIFSENVRRFGGLASAGLGLLNLSYSRGDETQADELGFRYMTRIGYDPEALVGVFQMLTAVTAASGGRIPQWQSTHPNPENREAHIRDIIAKSGVAPGGTVGRDALLDRIDGLVYGDDPRQGYFDGSTFYHPELRFEVRFPSGWQGVNQRTAVIGVSPDEDAVVILGIVEGESDPGRALRAFLSQDGVAGGVVRESEDYGIPLRRARFTARTDDGDLRGEAAYLSYGGTVYRLIGYASSSRWPGYAGAVEAALGSFAPVTDAAVLDVQPKRLELVRIPDEMTLETFMLRYPSTIDAAEVARLNRLDPTAVVPAGTRLKRVVGGVQR